MKNSLVRVNNKRTRWNESNKKNDNLYDHTPEIRVSLYKELKETDSRSSRGCSSIVLDAFHTSPLSPTGPVLLDLCSTQKRINRDVK